jgi:hypothetical protein
MRRLDDLAAAFIDRTLPKAEWTHEAHLRVGTWHVLKHGREQAMELLRQRIPPYNLATGGENTDTDGYHDTITWFYVVMIAHHLEGVNRARDPDRLADEVVAALGDRELPYRYYSKEYLMSVPARHGIVPPDRAPLPGD